MQNYNFCVDVKLRLSEKEEHQLKLSGFRGVVRCSASRLFHTFQCRHQFENTSTRE
jgi:hypothetical protein